MLASSPGTTVKLTERLSSSMGASAQRVYRGPGACPARRPSIFPQNPDHHALDAHVVLVDVDGLHAGVGRLKPDLAAALPVELLQGHVVALEEGDDHLPVPRRLAILDDHVVPVADL